MESSLGPLRARAAQLEAAAARERATALHTYETSARPALKQQAASLKESLGILSREEAALRERLAGLVEQAVAGAAPGVHTGFNVIRARAGADGGALPLEELRAERQRLMGMLEALGAQVRRLLCCLLSLSWCRVWWGTAKVGGAACTGQRSTRLGSHV